MPPPILCLMGPTASGKTALAVHLVQRFPLEIVSVDSVMVYRGMNIGAAKPDAETLARAPHHLIDIREPYETYSAAQFCSDALRVIEIITAAGKIPLLTGGTMLYFNALQRGLSGLPSADPAVRAQLLACAAEQGWPALHAELQAVDAAAAARIHPHDSQRIQRALEVYLLSGRPISDLQARKEQTLDNYSLCNIVISPADRNCLHTRVALRFEQMLAAGFIDEVQSLLADRRLTTDMPAMRSAGYRQVCAYLAGEISAAELSERGIIATRQLAKRQLTWLRHWPETTWFDSESPRLFDDVAGVVSAFLQD